MSEPLTPYEPLTPELQQAATALVKAANGALGTAVGHLRQAERLAQTARHRANGQHQLDLTLAATEATEQCANAILRVKAAVELAAPGVLGAAWASFGDRTQPVAMLAAAEFVRCGRLVISGAVSSELPLLLPLLDHGNVVISSSGTDPAVLGVVQEIVLRALLGTGAGQLSLAAFDPLLTGSTAPFSALRSVREDLFPHTLASAEELDVLLQELSADVRRIADMYRGSYQSLGHFRRAVAQPIERYRLVVLLDYPTGFSEATHQLLLTLMRTGPACGISLIVHHNTRLAAPKGVYPAALGSQPSTAVLAVGQQPRLEGIDAELAEVGIAPSLALIEPAIARLQLWARDAAAPRVSFTDLQLAPDSYWTQSSAERIVAHIGREGHSTIEVTLGDEREQRHNVLITGAVGQGKSNLILVLIHSLALRYSPEELEMYLLDFKDGLSFYPLAPAADRPDWLPHARVIGLNSDRAYGAAVLSHLVAEFDRRAGLMRPYGDNVSRFRAARPDDPLPRIVAVIDEFQDLFAEDDELTRISLAHLDTLARKGRAYGIHLVLASQTLSGITGLLAKQDGIFAQFPIRLALHNSPAESRAALSQDNVEAARLRYRGEVVVNQDFGQVEANRRGVVALADPAEMAELRRLLWHMEQDPRRPALFDGAEAADLGEAVAGLTQSVSGAGASGALGFVGRPVAVSPAPLGVRFGRVSGRHVSILGAGTIGSQPVVAGEQRQPISTGVAILHSLVVSLGRQHEPGQCSFVLWNLLPHGSDDWMEMEALHCRLSASGHEASLAAGDGFRGSLQAVTDALARRSETQAQRPIYLIGAGLDRAVGLGDFDLDLGLAPVDALQTVWRTGSQLGVHLIGWWSNVRAYRDQLGLLGDGTVDVTILLRVSGQDVMDYFGPFTSWAGPRNRGLLRDIGETTVPIVFVPYRPLPVIDTCFQAREA